MEAYDKNATPEAFGLNNTGIICYLNSFLQMLAGCTSLSNAILQNADYVSQTRTGVAMLEYVKAFAGPRRVAPDISLLSSRVLSALTADLTERRPNVRFGGSQESASEALVHILDMMEPSRGETAGSGLTSVESPITRLFLHRFRCDLHCQGCREIVSKETDYSVIFNLFHFDRLKEQPGAVSSFSRAIRLQVSLTEDYKCPKCDKKTATYRVYNLIMVPEIIVCTFNLYVGYGGVRTARYFPDRLEFPAIDGGLLVFRLVGQIEHAGSLAGGHYWARGLRAGERVYTLNDTGVSPSVFAPTPNTYMLAYHYVGTEAPAAPKPVAAQTATALSVQ